MLENLATLANEDELARAVARLNNSKAPGASGILSEIGAARRPNVLLMISALLSLVPQVWRVGSVPPILRNAVIVPSPRRITSRAATIGIAFRTKPVRVCS